MICYFAPLSGAALSDSYFGKYKTVVYLSLVYFVGTLLLAVTAIPGLFGTPENPQSWGVFLSLFLIAVGTGGIKPNISSLGADQYLPFQAIGQAAFFSWFYLAINAGTFASKLITPLLKSSVHCFDRDDCYPLAFAIPALLMLLSIVVFVLGERYYRKVPPSGTFIPGMFLRATWLGAFNTLRKRECRELGQHWVFNANYGLEPGELFSDEFLDACRRQIGICRVLSPVIVFWTLFDQQDTTWTDQILRMNQMVKIGSWEFRLLPEQISVMNPVFVVFIVPLCQKVIYPFFQKIGRPLSSLRRMFIGMVLAAAAFFVAGSLELWIDSNPDSLEYNPEWNDTVCRNDGTDPSCVHVGYQMFQYIIVTFAEVFVSVSGLEFAYTESHPVMKATSSSLWLLTVGLGQVVFLLVENVKLFDLAGNLFLFAGLMFLVSLIFLYLSRSH